MAENLLEMNEFLYFFKKKIRIAALLLHVAGVRKYFQISKTTLAFNICMTLHN